jgi:hypothetical protein
VQASAAIQVVEGSPSAAGIDNRSAPLVLPDAQIRDDLQT